MSAGSGWSSAWNSTTTGRSGADDLLDQRQVIEVCPEGPDLPLAEVGYRDAGQLHVPSCYLQSGITVKHGPAVARCARSAYTEGPLALCSSLGLARPCGGSQRPAWERPWKRGNGMTSHSRFTPDEARAAGERIGIDWDASPFELEQFRKGMDIELEHGTRDPETNVTDDDVTMTAKIARAHLNEFPDYYTRLAKMEAEAEAEADHAAPGD